MDLAHLVLRHFDKVLLAAFAGWLAGAMIGAVAQPPELATARRFETESAAIAAELAEGEPARVATEDLAGPIRRALDPAAVASVETGAFPRWLAWRRPSLAFVVPLAPPVEVAAHEPPEGFEGSVALGRVDLSWSISKKNNAVVIEQFVVERRALPGGEWTTIATLARDPREESPPTKTSDRSVAGRTRYEYRLTEVAAPDPRNPAPPPFPHPLAPEKQVVAWKAEKETPRDVWIVPEHASVRIPPPDARKDGWRPTVTLRVFRWVAPSGRWVEQRYPDLREGTKPIGKVEAVVRGEPGPVDFSTGAELVEVLERTVKTKQFNQVYDRKVAVVKLLWPGAAEPEEKDESLPEGIGARN